MATYPKAPQDAGLESIELPISSHISYVQESGPSNAIDLVRPLPADRLYRRANISNLPFTTTAQLQPVDRLFGQHRALDAINFGTRIKRPGFNLFVIGPLGARMPEAVKAVLMEEARTHPTPPDWIYVNNFQSRDKPVAIELPAGRARKFAGAMHELIDDLKTALPAVFQSEDYQTRRSTIDEAFQRRESEAFSALREKAALKSIVIIRTPFGFALAPAEKDQVVPPDQFHAWPEQKRKFIQESIETLEKELEHVVRQIPQWERERRDEIRKLNRETVKFAVDHQIDEMEAEFVDLPKVIEHIERVRADLIDNAGPFIIAKSEDESGDSADSQLASPFDRYEVNVLVATDEGAPGAPIIEELHPTLGNLIGRIDYVSMHGVLMTNFRLIKPGALHRANGGYLLIDLRSLLVEPFSWTALKRIIRQKEAYPLSHLYGHFGLVRLCRLGHDVPWEIKIEDVARFLGLTSTVSLEPDPIPLKVKVVLFGDRLLYFLLVALDPEVSQHFKVLADFENDTERNPQNEELVARLIASIAQRDELRPFDREAVSLMLEHAARLAEHAGKLTLVVEQLRDILSEADFWASDAKRSIVSGADVEKALAQRIERASRIRDRVQESVLEQVCLIDTAGASIGQINGLSLSELGGFTFGRPTRITCQVRPGSGKVVDIEREVELGGPIHSKGVLILSGFLAGHYALDVPMSLYASLVFEQSYSGVEGDSASSAELCALISALAEIPLRQDLAVTGSVNQHGEMQAIGGVNEKIEGFFDICRARGLTGTQGVLIPISNVQHLMLRRDVVKACAAGRFAVYPIATIAEGIALLTGLVAGERGKDGSYPLSSINRRVEDRLRLFANIRKSFGRQTDTAAVPD